MNERIHQVLDGELSRTELSPEEQALLADMEATIAAAGSAVPRPVAPDLAAMVMARIAAQDSSATPAPSATVKRAGALGRALAWVWAPRPVAVRPAWGLALAAAVAAAIVIPNVMQDGVDADRTYAGRAIGGAAVPPAEGSPAAEIYVHFRLDAPDASTVHLAGDFTSWKPAVEMHEAQPGVWTVIVPLSAGVHEYAFVIDGERWTPDPLGTPVEDGFGGQNSRLSILPPERIRA